jgi:hypothetical protein
MRGFLVLSWPPDPTPGQVIVAIVIAVVCLGSLYLWGPTWWHFKHWDYRKKRHPDE